MADAAWVLVRRTEPHPRHDHAGDPLGGFTVMGAHLDRDDLLARIERVAAANDSTCSPSRPRSIHPRKEHPDE